MYCRKAAGPQCPHLADCGCLSTVGLLKKFSAWQTRSCGVKGHEAWAAKVCRSAGEQAVGEARWWKLVGQAERLFLGHSTMVPLLSIGQAICLQLASRAASGRPAAR